MKTKAIREIVLGGFFLALALAMPFLTMQIPEIGAALLPMHLPVLLCGFFVSPPIALIVGFIAPLLRSFIFSMPPLFPTATVMAFELAAYGFFAGYFYKTFPKRPVYIYLSLILSMIAGRLIWAVASLAAYGVKGNSFTFSMFLSGAFINAIPGIIAQIIFIPIIIMALKRSK